MSNVLNRKVLVLNKHFRLINEVSVEEAIKQMCTNVATALDFSDEHYYIPIRWEEWIKLPLLNDEEALHTPRMTIRMPTVIIAVNYDRIPKRTAKVNVKTIAERDGYKDYVTGETLKPEDWSIDHLDPKSRGGSKKDPSNMALLHKKRNSLKGNRTPEEMGWPRPKPKKLLPRMLKPSHRHHEIIIGKKPESNNA